MAPRTRFERVTFPLGGGRSIQLSYRGGVVVINCVERIMRVLKRASFCHSRARFPTMLLLSGWLLASGLLALPSAALSEQRGVEQFAPVVPGYQMVFPRDHAAHTPFRIEWWYFTGFLELEDGGRRSFQITFFRYRPAAGEWSENPSSFTPRQIIMAHAAMGNPDTGQFDHWQQTGRVGLGLAGASETRLDVFVQDWSLSESADGWRSVIELDGQRWALDFGVPGQAVRHGDDGVSSKGESAEQASYYYSYPSMRVSGELMLDGSRHAVSGRAWMDHEWSSEPLDPDARGWDWLGLRLDDGGALMVYRFRAADGSQRLIGGSWVDPQGDVHVLTADKLSMEPGTEVWQSPQTGATYPMRWEIVAPPGRLLVQAMFPNQEMVTELGPRYWEGAVRVSGAVGGEGFLEMTGYAATGGTPMSGQ